MKSTTFQIINKTAIPGASLHDALTWLLNNGGGGGGGGSPTGPAGGDLTGSYPNPTLAINRATKAEFDAFVIAVADALAQKQATLVSGTNIKTINSTSLLGAGDLAISGSGVTDHGALTGLADDDHPQYHTDTRGDARYSQLGHTHSNVIAGGSAGFMTGADKTKLDGIANGATANVGDVTLAGAQSLSNKTLVNPALQNAAWFTSEYNAGNSGSALGINFADGQKQRVTLTANATFTLTFPGVGHYQLKLIQGGAGNYTAAFTGVSDFIGSATLPAIQTAVGSKTFINIYYDGTSAVIGVNKVGA